MIISVIMSDNRDLDMKSYPSLTAIINKNYCIKNNYNFIYFQPRAESCKINGPYGLRHCAWAKIKSVLIALESACDYVVYIDSDAIFKDFNTRIEEVLDLDSDICFVNDMPWSQEKPNTGFFACKNTPRVKQFLENWWSLDLYAFEFPWEQKALWTLLEQTDIRVKILDTPTCIESKGQFVRHLTNGASDQKFTNSQIREPYFVNFIKDNSLPNVISTINGFSYLL